VRQAALNSSLVNGSDLVSEDIKPSDFGTVVTCGCAEGGFTTGCIQSSEDKLSICFFGRGLLSA
jgi:hypothetical protein